MEIIHSRLEFRGTPKMRSCTRGVVWEILPVFPLTPQRLHAIHLDRGWRGAGYHYLIRRDGRIYELRPEGEIGAYCGTHAHKGEQGYENNRETVGVCFEGGCERNNLLPAQKSAMRALLRRLIRKYPDIVFVRRPRDMPGRGRASLQCQIV